MKIRRRRRQKGMSISINQCFICKKIKVCSYEITSGIGGHTVCEDCVNKMREQAL